MQPDFDATLNDFLNKVKIHLEKQDATLAEYEQFFGRAQELFPAYAGFVQHVNETLVAIDERMKEQETIIASFQARAAQAPQSQIANRSESKKTAHKSPTIETQEKKKILIVDDAEINRILMSHLFKSHPFTLTFANSGEMALVKFSQDKFDLILIPILFAFGRTRCRQIQNTYNTKTITKHDSSII